MRRFAVRQLEGSGAGSTGWRGCRLIGWFSAIWVKGKALRTTRLQLLSPRPKQQIITLSLSSLLSILEKAGAAALTSDVELSLSKLRAYLSELSV